MSKSKRKTGTREWSDVSVNCCLGCRHGCLYCYARCGPVARYRGHQGGKWTTEFVNSPELIRAGKTFGRKYNGVVMFPTTHDITPGNKEACLAALHTLLAAGNQVLVVTKPHLAIMRDLADTAAGAITEYAAANGMRDCAICPAGSRCEDCGPHYDSLHPFAPAPADFPSVEVRCSITCLHERERRFWEPGAPDIAERMDALRWLYNAGMQTSVSIEPCLQPEFVTVLVAAVQPYVTRTIWIGHANKLRHRTAWIASARASMMALAGLDSCPLPTAAELDEAIAEIEDQQDHATTMDVYLRLRDNPKIRWKDSYQEAIGLDGPGPLAKIVSNGQ